MKITDTSLQEVKIIEYEAKSDNRGFSYPVYNKEDLREAGIFVEFSEERIYVSQKADTLYGIHFQNDPKAQAKLLYCIEGRGIDYAIDLRNDSPTYLR